MDEPTWKKRGRGTSVLMFLGLVLVAVFLLGTAVVAAIFGSGA